MKIADNDAEWESAVNRHLQVRILCSATSGIRLLQMSEAHVIQGLNEIIASSASNTKGCAPICKDLMC